MNGIQTNYNNAKAPSFTANAKFTKEFKNQIINYVEKNKEQIVNYPQISIVKGNYMKPDGSFNSDKFFRNLKQDIADETRGDKGTYFFDKARSCMGNLFSTAKYFDENGKEVVRDRYRFNPTQFLEKNSSWQKRPDVLSFFSTRQDFWATGSSPNKQAEFRKGLTNLFHDKIK